MYHTWHFPMQTQMMAEKASFQTAEISLGDSCCCCPLTSSRLKDRNEDVGSTLVLPLFGLHHKQGFFLCPHSSCASACFSTSCFCFLSSLHTVDIFYFSLEEKPRSSVRAEFHVLWSWVHGTAQGFTTWGQLCHDAGGNEQLLSQSWLLIFPCIVEYFICPKPPMHSHTHIHTHAHVWCI